MEDNSGFKIFLIKKNKIILIYYRLPIIGSLFPYFRAISKLIPKFILMKIPFANHLFIVK